MAPLTQGQRFLTEYSNLTPHLGLLGLTYVSIVVTKLVLLVFAPLIAVSLSTGGQLVGGERPSTHSRGSGGRCRGRRSGLREDVTVKARAGRHRAGC